MKQREVLLSHWGMAAPQLQHRKYVTGQRLPKGEPGPWEALADIEAWRPDTARFDADPASVAKPHHLKVLPRDLARWAPISFYNPDLEELPHV